MTTMVPMETVTGGTVATHAPKNPVTLGVPESLETTGGGRAKTAARAVPAVPHRPGGPKVVMEATGSSQEVMVEPPVPKPTAGMVGTVALGENAGSATTAAEATGVTGAAEVPGRPTAATAVKEDVRAVTEAPRPLKPQAGPAGPVGPGTPVVTQEKPELQLLEQRMPAEQERVSALPASPETGTLMQRELGIQGVLDSSKWQFERGPFRGRMVHSCRQITTVGLLLVLSFPMLAMPGIAPHTNQWDPIKYRQTELVGDPLVIHGEDDLSPFRQGGTVHIATDGVLVLVEGVTVAALDGPDGRTDRAVGAARGGDGGSGGSVIIEADLVVSHGATLRAGDGGDGGGAFAVGEPHARGFGGDGGPPGRVVVDAPVVGPLTIVSGDSGDGGDARAQGADGQDCTGEDGDRERRDGDDGTAPGEDGESVNATAEDGACGPVDGRGGRGGDAIAWGGNGSLAPEAEGGHGGNATAIAGRGGDGMDACFATDQAARESGIEHAGHGGPSGGVLAVGGDGGAAPQGQGGDGGDAYARNRGGDGGNATQPAIGFGRGGAVNDSLKDGREGRVEGGEGGAGLVGGAGGGAVSKGRGGDQGSVCGASLEDEDGPVAPSLNLATVVAIGVIAAMAVRVRRRR